MRLKDVPNLYSIISEACNTQPLYLQLYTNSIFQKIKVSNPSANIVML